MEYAVVHIQGQDHRWSWGYWQEF